MSFQTAAMIYAVGFVPVVIGGAHLWFRLAEGEWYWTAIRRYRREKGR